MAGHTLAELVDELRRILKEEREILLSGHPERITAIAQSKLTIAEVIEEAAAQPDAPLPSLVMLSELARYNRHNAMICSAMLRHMTEALDRLRQHEPHRSYRPDGSESRQPASRTLGAA